MKDIRGVPKINEKNASFLFWLQKKGRLLLISIFILLFFGFISWRGYLSTNGYCHPQSRYLTDKEYILIAMSYVRSEMALSDTDLLESYLQYHPECCAVRRPPALALGNLIDYVIEVELNFAQKPAAITFSNEPYYTQYVELTACGGRGRMYGEGSSTLKKPRALHY